MAERTLETASTESAVRVNLIDCDVHVTPRSFGDFVEYMDEPWRSRAQPYGAKPTYRTLGDAARADSHPEIGAPGSDPCLLAEQVFVQTGTDFALLLPVIGGSSVDPTESAAFAAATNRWLAASWLGEYNAEERYLGAITVPVDNPSDAVQEIEQWAGHPGFRQVLIGHHSERPLGHPQYEPIWAAAAEHDLPVAMHFRTAGTEQLGSTATGRFQHFVDFHSLAYPMAYATHLVSWICSGVLDRYPNLRFVFVEGGFLWYRPVVSRLNQHWESTARDLPGTTRTPIEYVHDHFRWTSQPVEECESPREGAALLEAADAARVLMFSSDYPHYDYDSPARALPPQLSRETRSRIMSENARDLYGLPEYRAADRFDPS